MPAESKDVALTAPDIAENGAVSVERVRQAAQSGRPYDLVLMDMQMPEMNGLDATAKLRADNFDKPIIAVANSFTQFVPGHVHLKDMGQLVAREIEKAGGRNESLRGLDQGPRITRNQVG